MYYFVLVFALFAPSGSSYGSSYGNAESDIPMNSIRRYLRKSRPTNSASNISIRYSATSENKNMHITTYNTLKRNQDPRSTQNPKINQLKILRKFSIPCIPQGILFRLSDARFAALPLSLRQRRLRRLRAVALEDGASGD